MDFSQQQQQQQQQQHQQAQMPIRNNWSTLTISGGVVPACILINYIDGPKTDKRISDLADNAAIVAHVAAHIPCVVITMRLLQSLVLPLRRKQSILSSRRCFLSIPTKQE